MANNWTSKISARVPGGTKYKVASRVMLRTEGGVTIANYCLLSYYWRPKIYRLSFQSHLNKYRFPTYVEAVESFGIFLRLNILSLFLVCNTMQIIISITSS